MSLEDHQTGREIVSPYILVGQKELTRYAINTESFRGCQNWLVLDETMIEDCTSEQFRNLPESPPLIPVFAVLGDYNRGKISYPYGINRSVSFRRVNLLEHKMGYVPLEILRRELPKVYEAVKKDIDSVRKEVSANCPL